MAMDSGTVFLGDDGVAGSARSDRAPRTNRLIGDGLSENRRIHRVVVALIHG